MKGIFKRYLSLALVIVLMLGAFPASAFAADNTRTDETVEWEDSAEEPMAFDDSNEDPTSQTSSEQQEQDPALAEDGAAWNDGADTAQPPAEREKTLPEDAVSSQKGTEVYPEDNSADKPAALNLELGDSYVLKTEDSVVSPDTEISGRELTDGEKEQYHEQMEKIPENEELLLVAVIGDQNDVAMVLDNSAEFSLTHADWKELSAEHVKSMNLNVYILDENGTLKKTETEVRLTQEGSPALVFKTDRLEMMVLTATVADVPVSEQTDRDSEEAVDVSNHPLTEVGPSNDEPLLALENLSQKAKSLLGVSTQMTAGRRTLKKAPAAADNSVPTEGPVSADGMTIERVSVKWLSRSTGEEEPAGKDTLRLETDSDKVGNQQFQLDFALAGKSDYEPGTVEIIFPAYLWLDRYGNEPGKLTLSVPEDPETGADFAWKRVGDNIIITNVRRLSQASKVMIQGTFRDLKPSEMVDVDVADSSKYSSAANLGRSNPFHVTIGITTPNDQYIALRSNSIDATIDTHVEAASATKSAFNTSSRTYYTYHTVEKATAASGGNMPAEFLTEMRDKGLDPDEYTYVRWYISGSGTGSQPFTMTVNDSFDNTIVHYLDPQHQQSETTTAEGRMLGVQGAQVWDESAGAYRTGNVISEDGQNVSAVLFDGYNALPKSAYVWTAYKKSEFPIEGDEYRIHNKQVIQVKGWDDQIATEKEAEAEAPLRLPITYTLKKVWNDEGHEDRRPDHQSFGRYYNDNLNTLQTIRLTPEGDWTTSWNDEGLGVQYKVREYPMDGSGVDKTGRNHFMQVGNGEYSHVINQVYDEDGDLKEYDIWWYSLEKEEYDSTTHTWTTYNKYNEKHVVRTLVPFEEQKAEVGIRKSQSGYGNNDRMASSDRALNVLRRGDDVIVDYNVYGYGYIIELTKDVELEGLKITDFGFRDVRLELEDNYGADTLKSAKENTLLFDSALRLTLDDAEVAYVRVNTPEYLHYYQADKYSTWGFRTMTAGDFASYDRPDEELWGYYNDEWVRFAVLHVSGDGTVTVTTENGASSSSGDRNLINLPNGVLKVKTEMVIPGLRDATDLDRRIDGARMEYRIGIRLRGDSELLRERLEALFDANDYAMSTLDNYAVMNAYEDNGDLAVSLDDQARAWLHGRNHRVAVRAEKSFELTDNDLVKRELKLHSSLTMTQQSNVLEEQEYYAARQDGLIPYTQSGTWYDLLPPGIMPDVDSVKLTSGDRITDVYTVENYKESGRILLVVKADVQPHVSYTYKSSSNPYWNDDTYPKEGYKDVHTLEFDAFYSWDEARLYGIGNTVRNVAAYESDENKLGNINGWSGEPDDPQKNNNQRAMNAVGNDKELMTGLDPERTEEHSAFVYMGSVLKAEEVDFLAATELRKYVTRDGLGIWTTGREGQTQVNVYEGGYYSYMLYVASDSETTTKNIILLDSLESYVPAEEDEDDFGRGRWQGTFDSVDVSNLRELGIDPVVYYNTSELNLNVLRGNSEDDSGTTTVDDPEYVYNYLQGNGWTTVKPSDPSTVKAIAVDLRHNQDGTDFELAHDNSLFCTVRMRAPIYETAGEQGDPFNADPELRKDAKNNDYAFNNVFMGCTQVDQVRRETNSVLHYSYVRVGILPFELKVTKVWDDAENNDGKRPNSIRVHLLANGQRMKPDRAIELNRENSWQGVFEHVIQYDGNGDWINYTFEEESTDQAFSLDGYVQSVDRRGEKVTLTNTYTPEKTKISFTKTWQDDEQNLDYRPESITVRLMADGTFTGKTVVVKPDRNGNWAGSFTNLPKFTNPEKLSGRQHEIVYSVEEVPVYKYIDTYEKNSQTGETNINNRFYPYGNLSVQKNIDNYTEISESNAFTFTLVLKDPEGNDVTEKFDYETSDGRTGRIGNGDTFTLRGSESITVKTIPSETAYQVVEAESAGYTLVGTSDVNGTIRAGDVTQHAVFTNRYNAVGSQSLSLYKTLEGRTMTRYQFRFELVDQTEGSETFGEVVRTASADANGDAMFSRLSYTEADHGKTFTYQIREVDRGKPGYTYDTNTYTVKVTVTDNGNGTMTCTPKYYKADGTEITDPANHETGVVFHNVYKAKGAITLRAWKQLPDGELNDYGPFSFELIGRNADGKFVTLQTKQNDETGSVTFDDLLFTEKDVGKSFLYMIRETVGSDQRVIYDDTLRGVELTVADNGDGTLAITQTNVTVEAAEEEGTTVYTKTGETTDLPVFVNHLKPGDLSVTKLTEWDEKEPDGNTAFLFTLTLVGDELPEEITVVKSEGDRRQKSYTDNAPEPLTNEEKTEKSVPLTITSGDGETPVTGTCEFTLKAGQTLTVKELPAGAAYQIQESASSGWTTVSEKAAGVIVPKETTASTYTNTYEPGKATATIVCSKRLDGKTPPTGRYAFELVDDTEGSATKGRVLQTVTNLAGGFVQFNTVYTDAGTYHYILREVSGLVKSVAEDGTITYVEDEDELRKIAFDENTYGVTVTVTKTEVDGNVTLTADTVYDAENPPQFKNTTRPGSLQITKVGEGLTEANQDAVFKFKVTLSNDAGMPLTESGGMFWYAEKSEKQSPAEPTPATPSQPENAAPVTEPAAAAELPESAPRRALRALQQLKAPVKAPAASGENESEGTGKYAGGIAPSTTELYDSNSTGFFGGGGQTVNGSRHGRVKWTLYKDGTMIIEPEDGVSGTLSHYENTGRESDTGAIKDRYLNVTKKVRVLGTCFIVGGGSRIFESGYRSGRGLPLQYADLRGFDVSKATSLYEMIDYAYNLTYVDISTWVVPKTCNMDMWLYRPKLDILKASSSCYFKSWSSSDLPGSFVNTLGDPTKAYTGQQIIDMYNRGNGVDAIWVRVGYNDTITISFDPNGATGSMDSIRAKLTDQESRKLPPCTFESDMIFIGWSEDPTAIAPEYEPDGYYTGTAYGGTTVKLYAIWMSEDSFLLNFNANGGFVRTQYLRVNGPEAQVTLPEATHGNNTYKFLYWTTNPDGSGEKYMGTVTGAYFNAEPGSTIKLYAQFLDPSKKVSVTTRHFLQPANCSEDHAAYEGPVAIEVDLYDIKPDPEEVTPAVHDYKGFIAPETQTVLTNTNRVVNYYYDRTHYTLAFDANGGEGTMADLAMTGGVAAKLPVSRFTKENALFVGWNTAADGSGTNYGDGQSVNSIAENNKTLTLYAQWFSLDDAQSAEATNGEYTVTCKANETIVFPSLPAGTHYTITEVELPDGWSLQGIDNSTGTVLSAERVNVTATNVYSAKGYADLVAHKALPGESMTAGEFTFELIGEDGTVLQRVSNSNTDTAEQTLDDEGNTVDNPYFGTAPVYFNSISYDKQGVYHYTIREMRGTDASIRYDGHVENVTVLVKDRGDGYLITQVFYDESGANFINTMSTGDLTVSKTIRNATELAANKSFTFTLYLFDSTGTEITETYPVTMPDGSTASISSGGTVSIKGGESFTVTGLPHKSTYIAVENPADGYELVNSQNTEGTILAGTTQQASFENAYNSTTQKDGGGGAVIEARKVFENGVIHEDQFQFKLIDSAGEEVETVFAQTDGKITFSPLHFTLEDDGKRIVYYIEEIAGDDANIIYDEHRERVTVVVHDNGDGTMTASVEYDGETEEERLQPPVFTNKMHKGELEIVKELERYESSEAATFVFQVEATLEGRNVYSNVTAMTFTGAGEQKVLLTGVPVGADVTVTEVYSGAKYTANVTEQSAVIQAPGSDPARVTFRNDYNNSGKGGHGILNRFESVPAGEGAEQYKWADWQKPEMNNG